ncbi:MAG: TolC family protein [Pirellulales bacterium]|nr:TolC family protein [Pirellulales bacterium]
MATGMLLALPLANNVARAGQAPPEDDTIKKLLTERLVVYAEIHSLVFQGFKLGEISITDVLQARAALLSAELDLCETKPQRIEVHERMVQLAQETYEIMEKLARIPHVSRIDLLKAKAHLLEAKIGLERAKRAP